MPTGFLGSDGVSVSLRAPAQPSLLGKRRRDTWEADINRPELCSHPFGCSELPVLSEAFLLGLAEAPRDKQSLKVTLPAGKLEALPRHCFLLPLMNMSQPCHHHTLATALQGVCGGRRDHLSTRDFSQVSSHIRWGYKMSKQPGKSCRDSLQRGGACHPWYPAMSSPNKP